MIYKILCSKIQIPELQKNLIIRERLVKKIDSAAPSLVILHGTVGYGKTVLLSQYMRLYEIPCAWYHLDVMDNAISVFFEYLSASVKSVWEDFSFCIDDYADENRELFVERISLNFVACLNEFLRRDGRKTAIVLDDFQVLENRDIFLFIRRLLAYSEKNLRLYIATKSALPEFAAAHLIREEACIIEMEALAFNEHEVAGVLERILHQDISMEISQNVYKKTEGWPAGTMFMAQYFKSTGGLKEETDWNVIDDEALIQNYLMNELFYRLPYDIQQFLIKTSVLDELCVGICNYTLNITDARSILNYLIQESLFILRISKGNGYYRYHSIFKRFLMKLILPEQKKEILDRAAKWYLKKGNADRALECWIQNDNREKVKDYFGKFSKEGFESVDISMIKRCRDYLDYKIDDLYKVRGRMRIRYFGGFSVVLGEEEHEISWRTKKTAELFAYLSLRDERPIRREELLKTLWPEDFPNNAVAMLHNMFYNIRKELTPYGQNERIVYAAKEYFMDMSGVISDVETIDKICRATEEKDIVCLVQNAQYFAHYWGVYLEGIENTWCTLKRSYYERCFLEGCELLGKYYMKKNQYTEAIRTLKSGLLVDIYCESLALLLMKCYGFMSERKEGKKLFEKLCKIWENDLGIVPGKELVSAYEACLHGEI